MHHKVRSIKHCSCEHRAQKYVNVGFTTRIKIIGEIWSAYGWTSICEP